MPYTLERGFWLVSLHHDLVVITLTMRDAPVDSMHLSWLSMEVSVVAGIFLFLVVFLIFLVFLMLFVVLMVFVVVVSVAIIVSVIGKIMIQIQIDPIRPQRQADWLSLNGWQPGYHECQHKENSKESFVFHIFCCFVRCLISHVGRTSGTRGWFYFRNTLLTRKVF